MQSIERKEHTEAEKAQFFEVADAFKHHLLTGGGQLRHAGIRGIGGFSVFRLAWRIDLCCSQWLKSPNWSTRA